MCSCRKTSQFHRCRCTYVVFTRYLSRSKKLRVEVVCVDMTLKATVYDVTEENSDETDRSVNTEDVLVSGRVEAAALIGVSVMTDALEELLCVRPPDSSNKCACDECVHTPR